MWNLISTRVTQFDYFDRLLDRPRWKGSRVLDFGGNVGTFLVGAGDNVADEDYVCLDLNRTVIDQGRLNYPKARFVHYERYSPQYNPTGVRGLPIPDCGSEFDIILAFSVFTHTDWSEMVELVGQLRAMLAPRGVVAFTFCDPNYERSSTDPGFPPGTPLQKFLEWQRAQSPGQGDATIDAMVERVRRSRWFVVIDDELYVEQGSSSAIRHGRDGPTRITVLTSPSSSWRRSSPTHRCSRPSAPSGSIAASSGGIEGTRTSSG